MAESLVITRITHSCHLIQIGGLTVLTDPWFSQRTFYHPGEPIALQPGGTWVVLVADGTDLTTS